MRWALLGAADTIPSDIGVGVEFFRSKVDSFPDPHFEWSEVMPLPEGAQKMLASHDARFQLVDVNPAFQNRSSEILLLIKPGTDSLECSLERPKKDDVQAVTASPDLPNAGIFPYRTGLALLVNFFDKARGIYLLPLPLRPGTKRALVRFTSYNFPQSRMNSKPLAG